MRNTLSRFDCAGLRRTSAASLSVTLDVQAMGMFLIGSYVVGVRVECNNIGLAAIAAAM